MALSEPKRWAVLALEVTAIGLCIRWGLGLWESPDFYTIHAWVGLWFTLSLACLAGGALWSFYVIFPEVLREIEVVSHVLAAALFIATFMAVTGLAVGINRLGAPTSEVVLATLVDYYAVRRASNASTSGHFGVLEVADGTAHKVPLSVINKLQLRPGDRVPVLLHRGNLFDWGVLRPQPSLD